MSANLALVVDQSGASLELGSHETLALVHPDGRRERVGLRALGSVVLQGDVGLSTGVLNALACHGVALTTLSQKGRTLPMGFGVLPNRQVVLRHCQHKAYADETKRLALAKAVVWAKLEAMAEFARDHAPDAEQAFYQAMASAAAAMDVACLMGVEGAATVKHFDSLASLYRSSGGSFLFNGRSRQPPLDEPNALMSLAYTLSQSLATQLALHAGLDVQLGFLHTLRQDRESLALDLIEAARPKLDAWVFRLLQPQGLLVASMFLTTEEGSVWLSKEGRSLFYPAWFREGYTIALRPMRSLLAVLLTQLREFYRHEALA